MYRSEMASSEDLEGEFHTVEDGQFAGWRVWVGNHFETHTGPFYWHTEENGTPIYATGRIVRETKSMVFVQGQLEQNGHPILGFSSAAKKLTPR